MKHISLWPEGIPDLIVDAAQEPCLIPYFVSRAGAASSVERKAAVIVCPGGGYGNLAEHEGEPVAKWLNDLGIDAFVLQYRVAPYEHPNPLRDAQRAIRIVRKRAEEWNIDSDKIGILGFSAGGHLAASAGVHDMLRAAEATSGSSGVSTVGSSSSQLDSSIVFGDSSCSEHDSGSAGDSRNDPYGDVSARPDLMVLCYPVISMLEHVHQGSRTRLLGEEASEDQIRLMSLDKQVSPNTPPAFIWHTTDDPGVPVENSLLFAAALSRYHVPYDLHTFESGQKKHGHGLATAHPEAKEWTKLCALWLKKHGFVRG